MNIGVIERNLLDECIELSRDDDQICTCFRQIDQFLLTVHQKRHRPHLDVSAEPNFSGAVQHQIGHPSIAGGSMDQNNVRLARGSNENQTDDHRSYDESTDDRQRTRPGPGLSTELLFTCDTLLFSEPLCLTMEDRRIEESLFLGAEQQGALRDPVFIVP